MKKSTYEKMIKRYGRGWVALYLDKKYATHPIKDYSVYKKMIRKFGSEKMAAYGYYKSIISIRQDGPESYRCWPENYFSDLRFKIYQAQERGISKHWLITLANVAGFNYYYYFD